MAVLGCGQEGMDVVVFDIDNWIKVVLKTTRKFMEPGELHTSGKFLLTDRKFIFFATKKQTETEKNVHNCVAKIVDYW